MTLAARLRVVDVRTFAAVSEAGAERVAEAARAGVRAVRAGARRVAVFLPEDDAPALAEAPCRVCDLGDIWVSFSPV